MIKNPILTGFHADPCICRRGDDYYLMVSSFEWFPGLPVYHSKDLKNWELYTHVLTDDTRVDLRGMPSAKGVWAPCLTWCEADSLFYVVYGVMKNMNARYFDCDNYVITAPDIRGPWSEPVYLHSAGFDASMLHDDDGRKYVVSLEWEVRDGYEKPGIICLCEYDPARKKIVGYPRRIWRGGTDRGCLEGPHMTKRNGLYYLMCAEGGTGYNHCATMARATDVWGPYEGDPENPILTSQPKPSNERADPDHLKPRYYNPDSVLQKSGHMSYVDLPNGETYAVFHTARPFLPELYCTLGRETAIQKMRWTEDGWLRTADGGRLAREYTQEADLPEVPLKKLPVRDDFDSPELGPQYYAPRISPKRFTSLTERPGWLAIRGQEAGTSLYNVSLVARKLTGVYATVTTRMDFEPEVYQHSAGLILCYDNMNWVLLRKYWSQTLGRPALSVVYLDNGERHEYTDTRTPAPEGPVWLRLTIRGRDSRFSWSADGESWQAIGGSFDTAHFSDEYCRYGEFTGAFVGMTCADRVFRSRRAYFDFFEYDADGSRNVE